MKKLIWLLATEESNVDASSGGFAALFPEKLCFSDRLQKDSRGYAAAWSSRLFIQLPQYRPPLRISQQLGAVAELVDTSDRFPRGDPLDLGVCDLCHDRF